MSFILDALKKLEREKEAREPGVVMVGPVPWGERDRRRGPGLAIAGALLVAILAGAFLLWLRSGSDSPPARAGEEGTAAPSEEAAVVVPEPGGHLLAGTPPNPLGRASVPATPPPEAGPTAPPPRERLRAGDPPPLTAPETPPAAPVEARGGETDLAAPELTDLAGTDGGEPAIAGTPAGPEDRVEDVATEPAARPEPRYRLTAISSRDGRPIALLNDRLVREGDSFDGITVVKIGETSVEIDVGGTRETIGF